MSIAEEHFASSVIRGRMLGLARGWGRGLGPVALLACLPGEQHELGLIAFGLALHARGWRIAYLGSDTPLDEIERASANDPDLIVLCAVSRERIRSSEARIGTLAKRHRVALGGAGAVDEDAKTLGVLALTGDPVTEAERITSGWTTG
jgi:methanogenic corrinoid protein MtbC1